MTDGWLLMVDGTRCRDIPATGACVIFAHPDGRTIILRVRY